MANIEKLVPKILKWEGGFGNDPADPGGATNKGITIATWRQFGYDKDGDGDIDVDDLKVIDIKDFTEILRVRFWNVWQSDTLPQSIAEILTDWLWGSGRYAISETQKVLGVHADGIIGPKTRGELLFRCNLNARALHGLLYKARFDYIDRIVRNSVYTFNQEMIRNKRRRAEEWELKKFTFKRFEQGWKNRIVDCYKDFEP